MVWKCEILTSYGGIGFQKGQILWDYISNRHIVIEIWHKTSLLTWKFAFPQCFINVCAWTSTEVRFSENVP